MRSARSKTVSSVGRAAEVHRQEMAASTPTRGQKSLDDETESRIETSCKRVLGPGLLVVNGKCHWILFFLW